MIRSSLRFLASPGLLLMIALVAAVAASPARAHEVHTTDHGLQPITVVDAETPRALLRAFRETGNDDYLESAWALIETQLDAESSNADVLLDAALVSQARHEFDKAAELTLKAIELRPRDDQAWLLLASIHLVRGKGAAARAACRQLRNVPPLVSMTCRARVALAENDAGRAYAPFTRLLEISEITQLDPELLAWSLAVAGDLAKSAGQPAAAVQHFTTSLDLAESAQVRSALVDVLLETGDIDDAARVIHAGAPALPLEVRRMIVARRLGHDVADDIHHADHEFRHWIADEDWLHAREMARFYLDVLERPKLARRLAQINLTLQREPEDLLLASRTAECASCW